MELPLASLLPWLDIAGISVFAASGVLAAVRKRLDFVGACFFALITATGGGTVRDVLIGVPIRLWPERALDWFDAAGLAAYAVYGAAKALQFGISPVPAAAAGIITACI